MAAAIENAVALPATERQALVKSRIGQGFRCKNASPSRFPASIGLHLRDFTVALGERQLRQYLRSLAQARA